MQKNIIRILCLALVLTLCFPMVACDSLGGKFGQLILDLLKGNVLELPEDIDPETLLPETLLPETMFPQTNAPATQPPRTEVPETEVPETEVPETEIPETQPPKTEPPVTTEPPTTEPPVIEPDPVLTYLSFDELDAWIDGSRVDAFFTPGLAGRWNGKANVYDYNVEYIQYIGWAAFYAESVGTFGYQIDDNEPVYSDDFTAPTEQAVIEVSQQLGGKTGSRMAIAIPVRDLSGEHTIKTLVMDAYGTVEVLTEFTLNKAEDPYAPVFFVPAADMASSIPGSPDIVDAVMSADNSYITITTGEIGDPWFQLPMINGKGYVASYVAIKYRTSSPSATRGEVYIGSGAGPCGQGDHIRFDLIPDGRWHIAILDLAQAPAVVDGVINYLRYDPTCIGRDNVIDLAYIAAFSSAEAVEIYDERFDEIHIDFLSIPTSQWTVSGHCQEVVGQDGHNLSAIVAAGGVESGALLHQGYIGLGEIDLSQFSKMIVYYGNDGSDVTIDRYSNSANNRIIVTSADQSMTNSPTEDIILAATTYTELGWDVKPLEIDLTGVDYHGPVFVTYDTLPGNFMLISSVVLIYNNTSAN